MIRRESASVSNFSDHLPRREAFRFAAPLTATGIRIEARSGLDILSIMARRDATSALRAQVLENCGLDLPAGAHSSAKGDIRLLGIGPNRWLAIRENAPAEWAGNVAGLLADSAAVADQSGGFGVLHLAGGRVPDLLAGGVFVDLHESAFPIGRVASTQCSHFVIILWRLEGESAFGLAAPRSIAGDFQHWLELRASSFR
jgi:sarcosine oxidase subunit gamma